MTQDAHRWSSRRLWYSLAVLACATALVWAGHIGSGDWGRVIEVVTVSYLAARAVEHVSGAVASRGIDRDN